MNSESKNINEDELPDIITEDDEETETDEEQGEEEQSEAESSDAENNAENDAENNAENDAERAEENESIPQADTEIKKVKKTTKKKTLTTIEDFMDDYYHLKNKYYNMNYRKKSDVCVSCGAYGGSIFENNNGLLIAKCNSTVKKCRLDIQIQRGKIIQLRDLENNLYKKINEYKSKMISLKLDLLFGYTDEETTIELFKENNTLLTNNEKLLYQCHNYSLQMREESENTLNEYKETMDTELNDIKDMIQKYNEDKNNHQIIEDITTKYIKVVYPLIEKIRQVKYRLVSLICEDSKQKDKCNIVKVVQNEFKHQDTEMYIENETKIIKYIK
jgi:hypothetical protein